MYGHVWYLHCARSHLVHLGLGEDASNTAVFPAAELHAKITQLLQRCAAAAEAKAAAMGESGVGLCTP